MKILLCTPYLDSPDVVKGGINQWGQDLLSYYRSCETKDLEIIPVSFDRLVSYRKRDNRFLNIVFGVVEFYKPVKQVFNILRNSSPDIIHICTSAGTGCFRDYLLLYLAKKFKARSVLHLHFGRIPEIFESHKWEYKILSRNIRMADVAIAMNQPTVKTLLDNGYTNVRYLPNPISEESISYIEAKRPFIKRVPKTVLFVGHVYRTKGVYELVKGCLGVENIMLKVVGSYTNDMKNDLLSLAKDKGNLDWIKFVGEIDHSKVLDELLSADVFVLPSYTEGFPYVILEAMACGCSIIATKVGAIPEMLDVDGTPAGVCINPQNSDDIYRSILLLLGNEQLKKDLASKAYERVVENYTIPFIWEQLLNIWQSCNEKQSI